MWCNYHYPWFLDVVWLAFMEYIKDQWKMAYKSALVYHPKDLLLKGSILSSYSRGVRTLSIFGAMTLVILHTPSASTHPIWWRPPNERITLVELFRGIGTGLAVVLDVDLTIWQFLCLCGWQLSIHPCGSSPFLPSVISTTVWPNCHSWVFCMFLSWCFLYLSMRQTYKCWVPWIWWL